MPKNFWKVHRETLAEAEAKTSMLRDKLSATQARRVESVKKLGAAVARLATTRSKLKTVVSKSRHNLVVKNAVPVGTEGGRWVTINGSPVYVKG